MIRDNKGFTLVELAIVIVIIGLLVGGVLQGQELIKQAKIRSTIKDIESYKAANILFKSKYNCVAGDCRNASTMISGVNHNGDGDTSLSPYNTDGFFFVWEHLSSARLIKGNYNYDITTSQYPKAPVDGAFYFGFFSGTAPNAFSSGFSTPHFGIGNFVAIMKPSYVSAFTPADAFSIDSKIDDGIASLGQIYGLNGGDVTALGVTRFCNMWDGATGATDYANVGANYAYRLTNGNLACRLHFRFES